MQHHTLELCHRLEMVEVLIGCSRQRRDGALAGRWRGASGSVLPAGRLALFVFPHRL
jgi:hypothetical protein